MRQRLLIPFLGFIITLLLGDQLYSFSHPFSIFLWVLGMITFIISFITAWDQYRKSMRSNTPSIASPERRHITDRWQQMRQHLLVYFYLLIIDVLLGDQLYSFSPFRKQGHQALAVIRSVFFHSPLAFQK